MGKYCKYSAASAPARGCHTAKEDLVRSCICEGGLGDAELASRSRPVDRIKPFQEDHTVDKIESTACVVTDIVHNQINITRITANCCIKLKQMYGLSGNNVRKP